MAFQNPEDNSFTPGPAPFLPMNTAPAEIGFIDFNNFSGEGREASQSWAIWVRSLNNN